MSIVQPEHYRDLLRMFNTNVQGKATVENAITQIRGVGRRFATAALKIGNIDPRKRAGELTKEEEELLTKIIESPLAHGMPKWMLNRLRNFEDGKDIHILVNAIASTFRMDMERMRKIRCNRGIRHQAGTKVRGQHTKSTGRFGNVVGVSRKKR